MKKNIIWSNMNLDIEDWRDGYKEYLEENGFDECHDNDDDLYRWMMETNDGYLGDEQMNLNKVVEGRILVIADLGLWNGRKSAYKIVDSGNIKDILGFTYDCAEFYGDGYNIRGTEAHHDGINHYLYRVIREDRNIQNLLDDIWDGKEYTMKKLNYYTKSLYKPVAEVYGWR